jgi:hypothetical protein
MLSYIDNEGREPGAAERKRVGSRASLLFTQRAAERAAGGGGAVAILYGMAGWGAG